MSTSTSLGFSWSTLGAGARRLVVTLVATLGLALAPGCGNETMEMPDQCSGAACFDCTAGFACQMGKKCDPASKSCVDCLVDNDCPLATLCRASSHTCVPACSGSHGCGDAGVCEADAGVCVECVADADCRDSKAPRCDAATSRCVACLPADVAPAKKDNCAVGQYCEVLGGNHTCQPGCKEAADCVGGGGDGGIPSHTLCDTRSHACAECLADGDCGVGRVCRGGSCGDGCNDQRPCPNGLTCCNGACSDVLHDALNCKACGISCGAGGACCAGGCSVPAGDTKNCGACGNVCSTANGTPSCINGACAVGFCTPGFGDCNGSPADGCETSTDSNVNHCGSCGFACSVPNAQPGCVKGACAVATCLAPFADCNGKAIDGCETNKDTDVLHCGGCGRACSNNNVAQTACAAGRCTGACTAGFADCNNDKLADGCEIAIATDVLNCGACGNSCSANHGSPSCAKGACAIACAPTFGDCDGDIKNGCENSLNSNNNCGACGKQCVLTHAVGDCGSGSCKIAVCEAGWADCDGNPANGCEVATATDAANCGKCNNVCPNQNGMAACNGGICSIGCGMNFADCNRNIGDGCEINVGTDVANCGVCGSGCSANHIQAATCAAGTCGGTCTAGFADCNANKRFDGCETNTNFDVLNCGTCGTVCSLRHAVAKCDVGNCAVAACDPGFSDCNANYVDGCETPTATSIFNCGACNRVCSSTNGTPSCSGGACAIACAIGFADCNNNVNDGCEVNLNNNALSCGACGRACSLPHATSSCGGGTCVIAGCDSGWTNCDGNAANGCEVNTGADPQNCGGCGTKCSINHANPTCAAGICQITCLGAWDDCNKNVADGCEASLNTDPMNCGGCAIACSPSNLAQTTCGGGVCNGICGAGFADCNGNKQIDGCEVDIAGDAQNCGGCGARCSSNNLNGLSCVAGDCAGSCNGAFADCDGNLRANGCEKGVGADVNNCGGCGVVCSQNHIAASCVNSACGGACQLGWGDCNMNLQADGCEVNIGGDVNNCGMCGTVCSGANVQGSACTAGTCSGACTPGFDDCDKNLQATGCEVNLSADLMNCGSCGTACSGTNVVGSVCVIGLCGGMCAMGFGNCDMNLQQNGCETDLTTDLVNCGSCGTVCAGTNVVGNSCKAGVCSGTCAMNFADCDMNLQTNGCEVNTQTDNNNCGLCGVVCGMGKSCVGGACK